MASTSRTRLTYILVRRVPGAARTDGTRAADTITTVKPPTDEIFDPTERTRAQVIDSVRVAFLRSQEGLAISDPAEVEVLFTEQQFTKA